MPSQLQPSKPDPAQEAAARIEARLMEAFRNVGLRLRAVCVSPENAAYFRKTACLASAITPEMMKDASRPTAEQKKAARNVFRITHELNEETRGKMFASGLPQYIEMAQRSRTEADPKIQHLQTEFLAGKLTWGEYNTARSALVPEKTSFSGHTPSMP